MARASLRTFVDAISEAVLKASDIAEDHELETIQRTKHWEEFTDPKTGEQVYRPKMITMRIPTWEDGVQSERDVQVPLQTLVTGQSLKLDELSIEMDVCLSGVSTSSQTSDAEEDIILDTAVGGGLLWGSKAGKAKLMLKFSSQEAPEGYARIDNHLVKLLP